DVIEKLKAAEAHYKDAVSDSDNAAKSPSEAKPDTPEAMLNDLHKKVHEAANLRLRQAEASSMLAAVHASHAGVLARRQAAAAAPDGAAAATPLALWLPAEAVDAKIEDQLKEAKASAEAAYTAADELVQNVSEGATGTQATRSAARLERAIIAAGRAQLATAV